MTVELRAEPSDLPEASTARVDFLVVGSGPSLGKVESSISLVRDGSALIVIDPGMVSDRRKILDPLEKLSVDPQGRDRHRAVPSSSRSHAERRPVPQRPG